MRGYPFVIGDAYSSSFNSSLTLSHLSINIDMTFFNLQFKTFPNKETTHT